MLYSVEVRVIGSQIGASMTQMRTWLDHNRSEPDGFRQSSGGAGITFRVDFKAEREALAFAEAFDGRVVGMRPPGSHEHALWAVGERAAC